MTRTLDGLEASLRHILSLALLLAGCPSGDDDVVDDTDVDSDSDSDTDADTDETDTDGDTDTDTDPAVVGDITCTIGQGESAWVALEDGGDVVAERGLQGKWHTWISLRCEGLSSWGGPAGTTDTEQLLREDNPRLLLTIRDAGDDALMAGYPDPGLLRPMDAGDRAQLIGEQLVYHWVTVYEDTIDRDAVVDLLIQDEAMREQDEDWFVHVTKAVHIVAEPGYQPPPEE